MFTYSQQLEIAFYNTKFLHIRDFTIINFIDANINNLISIFETSY